MVRFPYRAAPAALLAAATIAAIAAAAPSSQLVSATVSGLASGNGESRTTDEQRPSRRLVSFDGRYVVFVSEARNLTVTFDGNAMLDVFTRDLSTGDTQLVSVNRAGTAAANGRSHDPTISADGRFVCFLSSATDLTAGMGVPVDNIYVRDLQERKTVLVSASPAGVGGDAFSLDPVMTPDGRFVAFASLASNLVAGFAKGLHLDVFVRDLQAPDPTKATEAMSVEPSQPKAAGLGECEGTPAISADGRYVAFVTGTAYPYPFDNNRAGDVFVRDRAAKKTEVISVNRAGTASANGGSADPLMSADGRFVCFISNATDMVTGPTVHTQTNVFVRDRTSRITTLVSVNPAGTADGKGASFAPTMSTDGRYVGFLSVATDLAAGLTDTNGAGDVLVRDLQGRGTALASVDRAGAGAGNGACFGLPALSDDGRYVVFQSTSADLADNDANGPVPDVFRRDLIRRTTLPASVNTAGTTANRASGGSPTHLSGDGSLVFFSSEASDLDPHDTNGSVQDVFASRPDVGAPLLVTDGNVSPSSLPSGGGKVALSVHVTSSSAITRAISTVTLAGGGPVTVALSRGAGSLYSGSYTAPANPLPGAQSYSVSFTANDAAGRQASRAGLSFTVAPKPAGPGPVVTNCRLTPARIPYGGGVLSISADVTASSGVLAVRAQTFRGGPAYSFIELAHGAGNSYHGTSTFDQNPASVNQVILVSITATDQLGRGAQAACPDAVQSGLNGPVITECQVKPGQLPRAGGKLAFSARVTAENGLTSVRAEVDSGGRTYPAFALPGANGLYAATTTAPFNPYVRPISVVVTIIATDGLGLVARAACPAVAQDGLPPPVVRVVRVTRGPLPAAGGTVSITARATAQGGIASVGARITRGKATVAEFALDELPGHLFGAARRVPANTSRSGVTLKIRVVAVDTGGQTTTVIGPGVLQRGRGRRRRGG